MTREKVAKENLVAETKLTSSQGEKKHSSQQRRQEAFMGWFFSAPAVFLIILFLIVPFVMAIALSFTNQRLIPNLNIPTQFIGFRNYSRLLFDDPVFFQALRNNFYFTILVVPLQTGLALFLAILVNQNLKGRVIFRTAFFLPVVVSMVVVSIVWLFLYNPDVGPINAFIESISGGQIAPISFMQTKALVIPAILLMSIWASCGTQMVIFLAGLQDIPQERYEAAEVDGANRLQQFLYITLPGLRNTTVFILLSITILSFRLYTQVDVMTQGGPANASLTMVLYTVKQGWERQQVGYASAISVVFFLIVLAISMTQRYVIEGDEKRGVQK